MLYRKEAEGRRRRRPDLRSHGPDAICEACVSGWGPDAIHEACASGWRCHEAVNKEDVVMLI